MTDGDGDGVVCERRGETATASGKPAVREPGNSANSVGALGLYDDNRNGHITCAEARRHGITPVPRGHPAYRFMTDGDGDGVVCE
ncbi:MAG: excalibur calcium-binding domain-containing protein [Boseongicola sp. SB0662_bin_57]|nr:excalibur calcium-binding domain-containing protein [Boseongicola sp. SB0662_bin_57]